MPGELAILLVKRRGAADKRGEPIVLSEHSFGRRCETREWRTVFQQEGQRYGPGALTANLPKRASTIGVFFTIATSRANPMAVNRI